MEINILYVFVSIIASAYLIFLFYDSTIKVWLSNLLSIENNSFKGSSLINADFSSTWLAGVDFQGANLSGVCWSNAKDFDLAIMAKQPFSFSIKSSQKKGEQMPNYLRAIAKSLTTIAGPFGVPIEFVLSLYDDQLENSREEKLDAIIAQGQSLTRESLDTIFEIRTEIKELREQFILGMQVGLTILMQNQELLRSSEKLEYQLPLLIDQQKEKLEEGGFLTKDIVVNELSKLYGADSELFTATVGSAGFPLETISQTQAPKVIFFNFINRCSNLKLNDQVKIFKALHKENPNNKVLQVVSALLQEQLLNQI